MEPRTSITQEILDKVKMLKVPDRVFPTQVKSCYCAPFERRKGHIALHMSVCRSVRR